MDMQTTLKRNPELLAVDMDGETVMMDMTSGNYFGINGVGSHIWELLENEQTVQFIIDSVSSSFEVNEGDTVKSDVLAFLQKMQAQKLLEAANG